MSGLFTWLGNLVLGVWRALKNFLYWFYAFALAIGYIAYKSIELIGDMTIRCVQYVVAIVAYATGHASDGCAPGGIGTALAICNTFFPLDEFFRLMFALLIFVWLPIGIYRFVKSLIPEVFGWGLGHE